MSRSWIRDFSDGVVDKHLLGGKGAGLASMTGMGMQVPPGFTVTTEACRKVMADGVIPPDMWTEVSDAMVRLEQRSERSFGDAPPLLVSVRSGASVSMPGMMDTVLNLGINDEIVPKLIEWSGDEHFTYDAYRRFIQMYSDVVLGLDGHPFQNILSDARRERGVRDDSKLTADDLAWVVRAFKALVADAGCSIPDDPIEQLRTAIEAVFRSWDNDRARHYRKMAKIPDGLGTAANVQMMVFGDLGEDSGTGVCFTRDPSTGAKTPFGEYLPMAQGEDVVAGIRDPLTLDDLATQAPSVHAELMAVMDRLEKQTRDMADIEFTVERGTLWILQTRSAKRTANAAVRAAVEMANEGLVDRNTALLRVDPAQLEQLERPRIAEGLDVEPVASGVAASPGAAQGEAIFDSNRAVEAARDGRRVLLVRAETTPDDIHGMDAADGILTSQGGKTSHAAVVARGMGKPAVTAVAAMSVNGDARTARIGDHTISEGDPVTIDGTTGAVYLGLLEVVEPEHIEQLDELLSWADEVRKLGVRANADTPSDAVKSRERGAEGIGLARTEHMFMGERLDIVQRIILAEDQAFRDAALEDLKAMQTDDFEGLLEAMDGLPVIVRLLDPPLHEFLPSVHELQQKQLVLAKAGESTLDLETLQRKVERWSEDNPMLGLRGVRLGIMMEHLYQMQAEAAIAAVLRRIESKGDPHLEIMVPLVSTTEELRRIKVMILELIKEATERSGKDLDIPIGTMIELPRAALTAGDIAEVADFFSFGTNDLTQMTYGLSRDDAEGVFLRDYLEQGILTSDPFQTIDVEGVGRLIRLATREGTAANPNLTVGVCGEHGGDPISIAFCSDIEGLSYVSCSPPRIQVARLAAAQAELKGEESATD